MTTQIPAPRVPFFDLRTGEISRTWYMYLFSISEEINLDEDFFSSVEEVSSDYSPGNATEHLMCSGTIEISLQSYEDRDSVLSITNIGTGVITITASSGEVIKADTSITLDFQWTTVQLCPRTGGYAII